MLVVATDHCVCTDELPGAPLSSPLPSRGPVSHRLSPPPLLPPSNIPLFCFEKPPSNFNLYVNRHSVS